jgi:hypothetical protein
MAALLVATAAVAVTGSTAETQTNDTQLDESIDSMEEAVLFARNINEAKGHLRASVRLAADFQPAEAEFHGQHVFTDYWAEGSPRGPIEPAVRNANGFLADELETELQALELDSTSLTAAAYEQRVTEEVFPRLDQAFVASVPERFRENTSFDVRVMHALLDRIDEEYTLGVSSTGDPEGINGYREYWDALGFIGQAEALYSDEIAPTLNESERADIETQFDRLQAVAAFERAPPSELTPVTNQLRSTLSDAANATNESMAAEG